LTTFLAGELFALLGCKQTLILVHLLFILPHPGNLGKKVVGRASIVRDGAVVAHLVEKTRDGFLDMRLGGVRGSLAIAMALLLSRRALALALGRIGGLAVLLLLCLELHLALLHGLSLGGLLHGNLLSLLRVHAGPKTANIAGTCLFLATESVWVDKVGRRAVVGKENGWRHGGLLRLVEVHSHVGIHVDTGGPAASKAGIHVHVNARVETIHHLRLHGHALDASKRQTNLLLILGVVMARAVEVLALLGLVKW
jgi:hypothetical protein